MPRSLFQNIRHIYAHKSPSRLRSCKEMRRGAFPSNTQKNAAPLFPRARQYIKLYQAAAARGVPGGMPAHRRHIDCYEDASIPLYLYLYLYLFLSPHSLPLPFILFSPFPFPYLFLAPVCFASTHSNRCALSVLDTFQKIFSKKLVVMLDITTMQCYTIDVTKIVTTIQIFWEVLHHEKGSHRMCGRQTGKVPRE